MTETDTSRDAVERLIAPIREHLEVAEARVNRLQYIEATIRVNAHKRGASSDQIEDFITGKKSFIDWMVREIEAERDAAWNDAIEAAAEVVEAERAERRAGNQTDGLWTAAQKIRVLRKGGDDGR